MAGGPRVTCHVYAGIPALVPRHGVTPRVMSRHVTRHEAAGGRGCQHTNSQLGAFLVWCLIMKRRKLQHYLDIYQRSFDVYIIIFTRIKYVDGHCLHNVS